MSEHTVPIVSDERLHLGGLMRCCTDSWDREMGTARRWQDGDVITCHHAGDDINHRMIREDGIWTWAMPDMDR